MAGLLDGFGDFIKTPEGQGLLSAAFGGLAGARRGAPLNSLGIAGMAGLQGYGGALDREKQAAEAAQMQKYRDMQQQTMQMQLEAAKRDQGKTAAIDALIPQFYKPGQPAQPGAAAIPGLTPIDSMLPKDMQIGTPERAATPAVAPSFDMQGFAQGVMGVDPLKGFGYLQAMAKDDAPVKLAPGEQMFSGKASGYKPLLSVPAKEATKPSAIQEYEYAKEQGYPGSFEQFQISQKRAGASKISVPVNMGQKGLDNTLKVRGDFRSEPIYKAFGEVQSAHSQITTALKQNSPAGDLAGATKLMKILDPGSVVRESELGMAMAASGLMDRVQNYASMVISGQKLTPTQRTDFQSLSDALMNESAKQYGAKRDEYKGIAERNGLNVEDILGPEPKTKKPADTQKQIVKTGMYQGRKVVQYSDGTTGYAD